MKLKAPLTCEPLGEPSDTFAPRPRRRQMKGRPGGTGVGHEPSLVAAAPVFEAWFDVATGDRAHFTDKLEKADCIRRPATEIECPPGNAVDLPERSCIGIHSIADVEDVTDLPP